MSERECKHFEIQIQPCSCTGCRVFWEEERMEENRNRVRVREKEMERVTRESESKEEREGQSGERDGWSEESRERWRWTQGGKNRGVKGGMEGVRES